MMTFFIIFHLLTFAKCLDWFFDPNIISSNDNSELIKTHAKLLSSRFNVKSEDGDAHKIRGRSLNQLPDSKNSRISRQLSLNFQPFNNFNGYSRSFPFQSPSNTFCKILLTTDL